MHRYFVTGTDTDVGKTVVTAALALALRERGRPPTVVKIVQTGGDEDAALAGRLSGCAHLELARFVKPADPWSAALAQGAEPLDARGLAAGLDALEGPLVAEGSGGIAVPLNASEHLGHAAAAARLRAVVAVGLRMGCISHTLLTLAMCDRLRLSVAGVVLVERWGPAEAGYRADVARALQDKTHVFGILPSAANAAQAVAAGSPLFAGLDE